MGGKGSGRGSGGARPGAGRPRTYKRVQMDDEAAQQFGELLARWQVNTPEANWTASKLLSYLITGQYIREQIADGVQYDPEKQRAIAAAASGEEGAG